MDFRGLLLRGGGGEEREVKERGEMSGREGAFSPLPVPLQLAAPVDAAGPYAALGRGRSRGQMSAHPNGTVWIRHWRQRIDIRRIHDLSGTLTHFEAGCRRRDDDDDDAISK